MTRWELNDVDRDAIVLELMLDAGLTDVPEVAGSLRGLGSFAAVAAPVPAGALAALIDGAGTGCRPALLEALPDDELAKRRRSRKRRPVVIGAAVLAAMGLGVGGVAAASGGFSKGAPEFMQSLISGWDPAPTSAPPSSVPSAPVNDAANVTTVPATPLPTVPVVAPAPSAPAVPEKAPSPKTEDVGNQSQGGTDTAGDAQQDTKQLPDLPKVAGTDLNSDSQGALKAVTDTLPKVVGKDPKAVIPQVLQDSQGSRNSAAAGSQGSTLRWILGLAR
ncbi:hypothetical protein [Arthrobacter sp. NyZ413]|uniref:hypothetical protein n=1 Tax=Arthrobacter sp. NyZ413 TaxID=3144669 RepID=UPI003BF86E2A